MKERSPFAKTFDRPPVRRADWDAVIKGRKAYDAACKRFFDKYKVTAIQHGDVRIAPEETDD